MRKTAIFVEGQTELIFVREYLLRYFNWQVDILCRKLLSDGKMESAEFDYLLPNAERHYQIINVGGDTIVLRRLLQREKALLKTGYDKIIGLRDMFTEIYVQLSKSIDPKVTQHIIDTFDKTIKAKADSPDKISFHFAIMETEAWLLGLPEVLNKVNKKLDAKLMLKTIGFDIKKDDPETAFFQPSKSLGQLFGAVGESYKKKKRDIERIMGHCTKTDIEELLNKPVCQQFNHFHNAVTHN
ncbi:MAG TPA: DUF4276 family protein [Bacteroidetes bacterium]|nr:DUF4276 family protein [Bacteroidota bacterium]